MRQEKIRAFGHMTYGIYALTAGFDTVINGMIASWVSQVSYEPPLVMAAVHPHRYSHSLIEKSGAFVLHVLERSQKDLLKTFKLPHPENKFSDISWKPGKTGAPILKNCLAWLEVSVTERHDPGNHTLFIGEVIDAGIPARGQALSTLDYDGVYIGKE